MQLVQPVRLTGGDDGGLARRQTLRGVKDRMHAAPRGRRERCGVCVANKTEPVRHYATWTGMRDHLIVFHQIDRREVPE